MITTVRDEAIDHPINRRRAPTTDFYAVPLELAPRAIRSACPRLLDLLAELNCGAFVAPKDIDVFFPTWEAWAAACRRLAPSDTTGPAGPRLAVAHPKWGEIDLVVCCCDPLPQIQHFDFVACCAAIYPGGLVYHRQWQEQVWAAVFSACPDPRNSLRRMRRFVGRGWSIRPDDEALLVEAAANAPEIIGYDGILDERELGGGDVEVSYVVFDFEAVRDEGVPHEPRPQVERISQRAREDSKIEYSYVLEREPVDPFPPVCHFRIACGAAIFLGSPKRGTPQESSIVAIPKILRGSEPDIIAQFMQAVRRRVTLGSFGGRRFDVPLIQQRGMRYGIDVSDLFSRDYSDRYRGYLHVDLADHLTNYGAAQTMKMAAAARLVGWPGKLDVDGSQVDEMVREGRMREVEQYCLQDTANEAAVLLRLELCRGSLTRGDYGAYARALLALVDREPDLEPLRGRIDRDLFLYCHDPGGTAPGSSAPERPPSPGEYPEDEDEAISERCECPADHQPSEEPASAEPCADCGGVDYHRPSGC